MKKAKGHLSALAEVSEGDEDEDEDESSSSDQEERKGD